MNLKLTTKEIVRNNNLYNSWIIRKKEWLSFFKILFNTLVWRHSCGAGGCKNIHYYPYWLLTYCIHLRYIDFSREKYWIPLSSQSLKNNYRCYTIYYIYIYLSINKIYNKPFQRKWLKLLNWERKRVSAFNFVQNI